MKVLLHICCAVCATSCVEKLRQEGRQVSGFFYNPNIQPEAEYLKRLKETERLAERLNFPLIVADYDTRAWLDQINGLEEEPEGGRRCARCFQLRLKETARVAQERGFAAFTTTLTVSPHKDAALINAIGQRAGAGLFLGYDFKKKDGFKRAQEMAHEHQLYRQHYCGCIFSLNASKTKLSSANKASGVARGVLLVGPSARCGSSHSQKPPELPLA